MRNTARKWHVSAAAAMGFVFRGENPKAKAFLPDLLHCGRRVSDYRGPFGVFRRPGKHGNDSTVAVEDEEGVSGKYKRCEAKRE